MRRWDDDLVEVGFEESFVLPPDGGLHALAGDGARHEDGVAVPPCETLAHEGHLFDVQRGVGGVDTLVFFLSGHGSDVQLYRNNRGPAKARDSE